MAVERDMGEGQGDFSPIVSQQPATETVQDAALDTSGKTNKSPLPANGKRPIGKAAKLIGLGVAAAAVVSGCLPPWLVGGNSNPSPMPSGIVEQSPSGMPSASTPLETIPVPSPTPKAIVSPSPEATATPEMALAPENQALIDTWMKGKGIPSGGFVDMHTSKPLNFGFLSETSGTQYPQDFFQGEIITGQQIDNNYYVFEGFIKNGVRYWAAFDAGLMDNSSNNNIIIEVVAGGNQWLNGKAVSYSGLTTKQLAEIMPKLAEQSNAIALYKNNDSNPPSNLVWLYKHHAANNTLINWLKNSGTQPSFINANPKAGDNPNAYPVLSEFFLPLGKAVLPQST